MQRDDIRGRTAPVWLQQVLTRRYGLTPHGEPRYRLVWAPSRYERSGGIWTDWDATISVRERQTAVHREGDDRAPSARGVVRRVAELRWVPKYPGEECWLIERWLPASAYGTPEQWYATASEGGTLLWTGAESVPACGDFPSFGDYEDIGARMAWYPTERHLVTAVDAIERSREQMPSTPWGRALRRTFSAQREQERRDRQFDQLCADVFDDASPAFGGGAMIGYAGTKRSSLVEMCERLGIREHPL